MTWKTLVGEGARDTLFDVAVHVAWADGRLNPSEVVVTRAVATALGLGTQDLGRAFLARQAKPLDERALAALSPTERALAYVVAAWVARADGRTSPLEQETLDDLAVQLGLDDGLTSSIETRALVMALDSMSVTEHVLAIERELAACVDRLLAAPELLPRRPFVSGARRLAEPA